MAVILPSVYKDGTATIAANGTTVTGQSTLWVNSVLPGDFWGVHKGLPIRIAEVVSNSELTLANPWPGDAQTEAPYEILLQSDNARMQETSRQLLTTLSSGNNYAFSQLEGVDGAVPVFTGPGTMSLLTKQDITNGIRYDEFVDTIADRATYDSSPAGFAVFVANVGDGRSALYVKNTAAPADWSDPAYITGPVGPAGVNQRGNYSAGTAYAIRDIVQFGGSTWIAKVATTGNAPPTLPTTENTQWLLFARSGTAGVVDRGAYSSGTTYDANDIVLNNGSTWLALQSTTGNAPPVLPTESNAYWRLLARKGTDGSDTGDVIGPSGASDGRVVEFSGTTGKLIKDGGVSITPFAKTFLDDADQNEARQTLGVVATAWEKIGSTITLTSQTAIDWVGLSSFRELKISGHFTASVGGGQLFARVSTDNGATFLQSASDYGYSSLSREGTVVTGVAGGAFTALPFSTVTMASNIVKFECHLTNFNKNLVSGFAAWNSFFAIQQRREIIDGYALAANQRNAVRIFMTAGVMIDGIVVLEGIRG